MTNAQAAAFFASLPDDEQAMVLLINGDAGVAEVLYISEPGANWDSLDEGGSELDPIEKNLPTAFVKW